MGGRAPGDSVGDIRNILELATSKEDAHVRQSQGDYKQQEMEREVFYVA